MTPDNMRRLGLGLCLIALGFVIGGVWTWAVTGLSGRAWVALTITVVLLLLVGTNILPATDEDDDGKT